MFAVVSAQPKNGGDCRRKLFPLLCSLRLALLFMSVVAACSIMRLQSPVRAAEAASSAPCVSCHREICERYAKTPMAHASGPAIDGMMPADYRHAASGIRYRVYTEGKTVWMSYERPMDSSRPGPGNPLTGRQELQLYLGSGKRGRTYLFQQEGYWFEAPINWYAKKQLWDMTPNHLSDREMPLTLPVDSGCLHCHASGVASSLPDARNHYAGLPFSQGGITCEGCHGDPSAHLASQGKVAMLKLNTLEPVRRDSVCLNCHLEGDAGVDRLGKKVENFRPGDNLFNYTEFFVYRSESGSGGRATSQWEALLESECKKKSGNRMTCSTCHDPHGSPASGERIMFYRQRCLQCHNDPAFVASHHPDNPDCTACHMARAASSDIAHEQVTDHFIRSHPPQRLATNVGSGTLEPVGGIPANDRELGLAYAQTAARGDREAMERAIALLSRAEKEGGGAADDSELHSRLGFVEQVNGQTDAAAEEYEKALKANPYDSLALGDLALIRATQRKYDEAERLWRAAFEHDPVQIGAGVNLAIVECETGHPRDALEALNRVLKFAPDNAKAYDLRKAVENGGKACARR